MKGKEFTKRELKKAFIGGYWNVDEENIDYAFVKWWREFVRQKAQMKLPKQYRD